MKIRVVSSREEISKLNPNEKAVHIAFRPLIKEIFGLVVVCAKLEIIQLSQSYRHTVSKSVQMFLEIQKTQLLEGDV